MKRKSLSFGVSLLAVVGIFQPLAAQNLTQEEASALLAEVAEARKNAEKALADAKLAEQRALEALRLASAKDDAASSTASSPPFIMNGPEEKPGDEKSPSPAAIALANAAILQEPKELGASFLGERPEAITLSTLAQDYFGLTGYKDYSSTEGVGLRFVGGGSDSTAELGIVFTRRDLFHPKLDTIGQKDTFHAKWLRFRPYLTASTSDGIGVIGTAKNKEFSLGTVGLGFDIRLSSGPKRYLGDARDNLASVLDEASAFCAKNMSLAVPDVTFQSAKCRQFIDAEDKGQALYLKGLAPFWGLDNKGADQPPAYYFGLNGVYGRQEESFYPLSNPGGTDIPTIPALPADLGKQGLAKKIFDPFFFKAYGGISLAQLGTFDDKRAKSFDAGKLWDVGVVGSIGYKSEVAYPADTEDQSLCYTVTDPASPVLGYGRCKDVNIAAPYTADGFTIALGLNAKTPRSLFGRPEFGVLAEYFDGFDQWHIKVPLVFAYDGDDKLKAGIQFDIRTEGRSKFGEVIEDEMVLGILLSHSFDYPFIP